MSTAIRSTTNKHRRALFNSSTNCQEMPQYKLAAIYVFYIHMLSNNFQEIY